MEHIYNIIINGIEDNYPHRFQYTYSRMNVEVLIASNSFVMVYKTGVKKTPEEIWKSNVVEDGIRKCLLAQLIFFGHNCAFEKVMIKERGADNMGIIKEPRIYNLIPSNIEVDLPTLKDERFVAEYLMKWVRSKYESGIAALFSYIYAKSKICEEDKFTYYWRAFNGIYNSIAQATNENGGNVNTEKECLKNWLKENGYQTYLVSAFFNRNYAIDNDYSEAEKKTRHFFYTIRDKAAKASWTPADVRNALNANGNKNRNLAVLLGLEEHLHSSDADMMQIEVNGQKRALKTSLYGYMMTEFAYHIRCEYFHAARPILLYTTLSNPEYRGLELANALLEHYLDTHILKEVKDKINLERELLL